MALIAAAPKAPARRPSAGVPAAHRGPPGSAARSMDGPEATPFRDGARFVSVDPTTNRARFYEVRLQATLWGAVALVRTWGRLGTPGRSAVRSYPEPGAARAAAERLVRRRLQRGYQLVRGR